MKPAARFILLIALVFSIFGTVTAQAEERLFLPLVVNGDPIAQTGNVQITTIIYDFSGTVQPGEYVEIKNFESFPIQLEAWTLSDAASHVFVFPAFVLEPDQVCRIYTNEYHPEFCGFTYANNLSIWNDEGDTASLVDFYGNLVYQRRY